MILKHIILNKLFSHPTDLEKTVTHIHMRQDAQILSENDQISETL